MIWFNDVEIDVQKRLAMLILDGDISDARKALFEINQPVRGPILHLA